MRFQRTIGTTRTLRPADLPTEPDEVHVEQVRPPLGNKLPHDVAPKFEERRADGGLPTNAVEGHEVF